MEELLKLNSGLNDDGNFTLFVSNIDFLTNSKNYIIT